jgi:signal transduction histidine kinase
MQAEITLEHPCTKIIALHDGTIDVRSREGHGTVIRIRLPLAPPA